MTREDASYIGWWMLSGLLVLGGLALIAPAYVNRDSAWYLHMVAAMASGATAYVDVIDTNPPLIVYLTMPPVVVAGLLGMSAPLTFKLYVSAIVGVSLVVVHRLLGRVWPDASPWLRPMLLSVAVFLVVPFVRDDFGQREHLAVLLTLPYVAAAAARLAGQPVSRGGALIGLGAGIGFAIKPHFLAAWVLVEVAMLAMAPGRRHWRRAEVVGVVVAVGAYGVWVITMVPQYLTLANEVRQVYGALNSSAAVLLRLPDLQLWALGVALLVVLRLPSAVRRPVIVLFAAATGFLLAGLLQLKGWAYHLYPSRVYTLFFFAALAGCLVEAHPAIVGLVRGGRRSLAAFLTVVLVGATGRYIVEAWRPVNEGLVAPLVELIRDRGPEGPVAILSMRTVIYPAFPAVNYSGAVWSLRHNSLWFLPGLYEEALGGIQEPVPFRAPSRMGPMERRFYEEVITDLCAAPPLLLGVEPPIPRAPAGRRALDLLAYYGQDPRCVTFFEAYRPSTTVGPFTIYEATRPPSCA